MANNINMKNFLEALEARGSRLDEAGDAGEGKWGGKWTAPLKEWAEKEYKGFLWAYRPEEKRIAVFEMNKDGEAKGSWAVASFTFGEDVDDKYVGATLDTIKEDVINEEEGTFVTDTKKAGTFFDVVKECISIVENKEYDMKGDKTTGFKKK
jgi:hypothetical protein